MDYRDYGGIPWNYEASMAKCEELIAASCTAPGGPPPTDLMLYVAATPMEIECLARDPEFGVYRHNYAMREIGLALVQYLDAYCADVPVKLTWSRIVRKDRVHVPEMVSLLRVRIEPLVEEKE